MVQDDTRLVSQHAVDEQVRSVERFRDGSPGPTAAGILIIVAGLVALVAQYISPIEISSPIEFLYLGTLPGIASGGFTAAKPSSVFFTASIVTTLLWVALGVAVALGSRRHLRGVIGWVLGAVILLLVIPNIEVFNNVISTLDWVSAAMVTVFVPGMVMLAIVALAASGERPHRWSKVLAATLLLVAILVFLVYLGSGFVFGILSDGSTLPLPLIVTIIAIVVCPFLFMSGLLVLTLSIDRKPRHKEQPRSHRPPARYDAPLNRAAALPPTTELARAATE